MVPHFGQTISTRQDASALQSSRRHALHRCSASTGVGDGSRHDDEAAMPLLCALLDRPPGFGPAG